MVGVFVTVRVILKYWKIFKILELKEWVNIMIKIVSYERLFCKLYNKNRVCVLVGSFIWEDFWFYVMLFIYVI